jgi:FkbM family methyltransferase
MTNELVFNIGMHDGSDTTYYLAAGFRVLAVEADPSLVAQVSRRFPEEIQSGQLIILNVAMAAEEGESEFWINETQSTLNSFNRETTARRGHASMRSRSAAPGSIR